MPDFQREEVWNDHQKRQLIDTVLRGWHLPKFYFRRVDESSFECVDGQQRLAAIWEFYDGRLKLEPAAAHLYGGRTYKELRPSFSDSSSTLSKMKCRVSKDLQPSILCSVTPPRPRRRPRAGRQAGRTAGGMATPVA